MISYQKAFNEGIATPLLLKLWKEAHENDVSPYFALVFRQWTMRLIVFTIIYCIYCNIRIETIGAKTGGLALICIFFSIGAILIYLLKIKATDIRFIRDCVKLEERLHLPDYVRYYLESDIKAAAEKRMAELALYVVQAQQDDSSTHSVRIFNNTIEGAHKVFLKFNLAEKGLGKYFKEASLKYQDQGLA